MDKMTDTNTKRKYNHKLKVLRTEVISYWKDVVFNECKAFLSEV